MNQQTINIINNTIGNNKNDDIKILNIQNKNIKGTIDLCKFTKLEELYCSDNQITDIINIPNSLQILNCSNNKIISLKLPNKFVGLDYTKNPLKQLCYPSV